MNVFAHALPRVIPEKTEDNVERRPILLSGFLCYEQQGEKFRQVDNTWEGS